jgi:hypothetical protein
VYPAQGFALFPPFPRDSRVFVAMGFAPQFEGRWANVIAPGIRDAGLEPFRVDIPKTSESIPAEIVAGIAESRLVFVDVTLENSAPNGNVMYELGMAHAVRQSQEVILFRSDTATSLLFDLRTIRVNAYDPDKDATAARALVSAAVSAALREVDVSRGRAVQAAANALDHRGVMGLLEALGDRFIDPDLRTMGNALVGIPKIGALSRLLELGLVRAVGTPLPLDQLRAAAAQAQTSEEALRPYTRYCITEFGRAVLIEVFRRWGLNARLSDLQEVVDRINRANPESRQPGGS